MVRQDRNITESWINLKWKQFRQGLFRLQKRVFKAVQVGDRRKARSLQKLILKSRAARLLAIRQVTQLNNGKKTAGGNPLTMVTSPTGVNVTANSMMGKPLKLLQGKTINVHPVG